MDVNKIGAQQGLAGKGAARKAPAEKPARINTNDYWVAGGRKFASLNDIGQAIKSGKLKKTKSGEVSVAHKTFRPGEAKSLKSTAKKLGMGALAGIGFSMGAAALGITCPAVILLPMMAGMLSAGVGMGIYKAAKAFETAPQIKNRGTVSLEGDKMKYKEIQ